MNDETTPGGGEVREGQRIAKVMARAGLCSRREAEDWIAAGRVSVNGETLSSPAYNVSDSDDVRVDGRRLAERERTRLFLFHKPRGLVTTARDPEGRPTIFGALPPDLPRVVAVGRLDINTEGLILLTNDGGLARVLELPATGWLRRYRVRAHGAVDQESLDRLRDGVTVDGVDYLGIEARLDREQGSNAWITLGLREGKNREIKKVLEHLGLAVNRLIRVSFGPFELGDLPAGGLAEVRTRVLRDQLGAKLARQAGADFDAPLIERRAPPAEPGRSEGGTRKKAERAGNPGERRGVRWDERERRSTPDGAPRRDRPGPSTPERRRKHVSALRAEIASDALGPRKRIERGATRDRRGREIKVERLTPAAEGARGRLRTGKSRNDRHASAGRQQRENRFDSRRGERGESPARVKFHQRGSGTRRFDQRPGGSKGPRHERAPASPGRDAGNRSRDFAAREGDHGRRRRERHDDGGPPEFRRREAREPHVGERHRGPKGLRRERASAPPRQDAGHRSREFAAREGESGRKRVERRYDGGPPANGAPRLPWRSRDGRPPPGRPSKGSRRGPPRPPRKR